MKLPEQQDRDLAKYIIEWLCSRNRDELRSAIEDMCVANYKLIHEELAYILMHKGHPPNWV
jgi:hypothetical protein